MTFLIDNQLPAALARHLESLGHTARHVGEVGMDTSDDRAIRAYAASTGAVIVSKDEDFFHLAVADPSGPQLIWVRLGNCRTPALIRAFDRVLSAAVAAIEGGQAIVEIR